MEETTNMDGATFLNVLRMTVENRGCSIVDLDFDNRIINLDGPDKAVDACALAIAELVGEKGGRQDIIPQWSRNDAQSSWFSDRFC